MFLDITVESENDSIESDSDNDVEMIDDKIVKRMKKDKGILQKYELKLNNIKENEFYTVKKDGIEIMKGYLVHRGENVTTISATQTLLDKLHFNPDIYCKSYELVSNGQTWEINELIKIWKDIDRFRIMAFCNDYIIRSGMFSICFELSNII